MDILIQLVLGAIGRNIGGQILTAVLGGAASGGMVAKLPAAVSAASL